MLSTLSSKVLDVIYMTDIYNNQLPLHSVSRAGASLRMAL